MQEMDIPSVESNPSFSVLTAGHLVRIQGLYLKHLIPETELLDTPPQVLVDRIRYFDQLRTMTLQLHEPGIASAPQALALHDRITRDMALYQHFADSPQSLALSLTASSDVHFPSNYNNSLNTSNHPSSLHRPPSMTSLHSTQRTTLSTTIIPPTVSLDDSFFTVPPGKDFEHNILGPLNIFRWTSLRLLTGSIFNSEFETQFGLPTVFSVTAGIAIGTTKSIIMLYDMNQQLSGTLGSIEDEKSYGSVTCLDVSSDQTQIVVGYANGFVTFWDLQNRNCLKIVSPVAPLSTADGHLIGLPIVSVACSTKDKFFSCDFVGTAFFHTLLRRVLYISMRSIRIHGKKVINAEDPLVSTTVRSLQAISKSNVKYPGDTSLLVAISSPYKIAILCMKPTPQIIYRSTWVNLQKLDKERPITQVNQSHLKWWVPTKNKHALAPSHPILAFSYENVLGILYVTWGVSETPEGSIPKLVFRIQNQIECPSPITSINWINSQFILCSCEDDTFRIYEASKLSFVESSSMTPRKLLQNIKWPENVNASIDFVPTFNHSICSSFHRLFALTEAEFCFATLLTWQDRISVLVRAGRFSDAFEMGVELYKGNFPVAVWGIPVTQEEREHALSDHLAGLVLNLVSMSLSSYNESDGDVATYESTCKLVFETCLAIEKSELIFGEIWDRFEDAGLENIFISILQNLILVESITAVPNPHIIQVMFSQEKLNPAVIEQVVLHLDPRSLDLNHTIGVCKKLGLMNALFYVYNRGLSDYKSPLIEVLSMLTPDNLNELVDTLKQQIYTLFVYIAFILTGKSFPMGELPEEEYRTASNDILGFLCSPTFLKHGKNSVLAVGIEPWPYFQILLELDTFEMLKVLGAVFDSQSLDMGIALEQNNTLLITRQYVINLLLHLIESGNWTQEQLDNIYSFIGRAYYKHSVSLKLHKLELMKIFKALLSSELAATIEMRQIALLSLYDAGFSPARADSDKEVYLEQFQKAQFWRVYERIVLQDNKFDLAIHSYIQDPSRQTEMYKNIRRWLNDTSLNLNDLSLIKNTIKTRLGEIVWDGLEITKLFTDYWPSEHYDMIESLASNLEAQFYYIGGLINPSENSTNIKSGNLSAVYERRIYDLYIRLMSSLKPNEVRPFLEWCGGMFLEVPYSQQEVLQICTDEGLTDGLIYLHKQMGNYHQSVTLCIDQLLENLAEFEKCELTPCNSSKKLQPSRSTDNDISLVHLTLTKQSQPKTEDDGKLMQNVEKQAYYYLNQCIEICENYTSEVGKSASEIAYYSMLERICFQLEAVTDLHSSIRDKAITFVMTVVSIPSILIRLFQCRSNVQFGKYKSLVSYLLATCGHQKITLEYVNEIVNSYLFEDYNELVKSTKSSFHPSLGQCQLCRRLFHIRVMTIQQQKDRVILFKCHHGYHLRCLKDTLETVQLQMGIGGSLDDYELWYEFTILNGRCVVCGSPSEQKRKGKLSAALLPPKTVTRYCFNSKVAEIDEPTKEDVVEQSYVNIDSHIYKKSNMVTQF
ncbi:Golgi CORVET complex core vacuolar protein 8-domain-containing protein [Globomyces pollinis-pini]|nr:Golgi CORVET complex core vacuolar protein 8-domain-containing protein [Globomyces pollinis-pini]